MVAAANLFLAPNNQDLLSQNGQSGDSGRDIMKITKDLRSLALRPF